MQLLFWFFCFCLEVFWLGQVDFCPLPHQYPLLWRFGKCYRPFHLVEQPKHQGRQRDLWLLQFVFQATKWKNIKKIVFSLFEQMTNLHEFTMSCLQFKQIILSYFRLIKYRCCKHVRISFIQHFFNFFVRWQTVPKKVIKKKKKNEIVIGTQCTIAIEKRKIYFHLKIFRENSYQCN